MFIPDVEWRCKEDLKVILITKEGRLTKALSMLFFQRFGTVDDCYILQQDRIACGVFRTELEAEEALKQKAIKLGGMYCDVTTFKSGNRKIYISPLTITERAMREYFESNYGPILRFEALAGRSAAFILFLKVDSAVACRNINHLISGINVYARPGCLPGTKHQPDRSAMYRVTPRLAKYVDPNWPADTPSRNNQASIMPPSNLNTKSSSSSSSLRVYTSPSFQTPRTPETILSPSPSEVSNTSSRSDQSLMSPFFNTSQSYRNLLQEMKDLSIDEIDGKNKRKKKFSDIEKSILNWRNTHVEVNNRVKRRGVQLTATSPSQIKEETDGTNEDERIVREESEGTVIEEVASTVFSIDDKWSRWEKVRKELNLPPIDPCAHYAKDENGFPIHHNGQYVLSILKDGRFRFKDANHVSFNNAKNTVELFKRAAYEYEFFGPRNPSKAENRLVEYDDDDIGGWEDVSEINGLMSKDAPSHNLKWPFNFPSQPRHYPLMEYSTFEDHLSLEINNAVRYMNHLEERWKNTKQHNFLHVFAPFLKADCIVCNVKLDGPRKQFEHIFSRPHLANLNRHKVKFSPSDFTFWNNVLLKNFCTGVKRRRSR